MQWKKVANSLTVATLVLALLLVSDNCNRITANQRIPPVLIKFYKVKINVHSVENNKGREINRIVGKREIVKINGICHFLKSIIIIIVLLNLARILEVLITQTGVLNFIHCLKYSLSPRVHLQIIPPQLVLEVLIPLFSITTFKSLTNLNLIRVLLTSTKKISLIQIVLKNQVKLIK